MSNRRITQATGTLHHAFHRPTMLLNKRQSGFKKLNSGILWLSRWYSCLLRSFFFFVRVRMQEELRMTYAACSIVYTRTKAGLHKPTKVFFWRMVWLKTERMADMRMTERKTKKLGCKGLENPKEGWLGLVLVDTRFN